MQVKNTDPPVLTGSVLDFDDFSIRVQMDNGVKTISREGLLNIEPGQRVALQGASLVGRFRKAPVGKTFQV